MRCLVGFSYVWNLDAMAMLTVRNTGGGGDHLII